MRFPVRLCFVSKYNSEQSPFLSPSRCILRSCVIRPHAHPWPPTPAGQAAPPPITHHTRAMFRRCPPACAHASGLLLTPLRAMRCEPALCGSMIASSRLTGAMPTSSPPWPWRWPPHVTHHHGHVAFPAHEFPARPAGSARVRFAQSSGFRLSEVLCRCVALVLLLFLLHSAAARVPAQPLFSADLAVADSPPPNPSLR